MTFFAKDQGYLEGSWRNMGAIKTGGNNQLSVYNITS